MFTSIGTNVSHKTHYARLGHAAQHLLPTFLQEVLLKFEEPRTIYAKCNQDKYLSRRLKPGEMTKLSTAVQYGYTYFDVPLIYSILRNLHGSFIPPTKGWEHPTDPLVNEIEIGDDLERCRRLRNKIIHRGNTIVTDQELHNYFNEFKTIAGRFEMFCKKNNNDFVSEVDDLRTCCMDEATEQRYLDDLKDFQQNDKDNEATISDLENKLKDFSISDSNGNVEIRFIQTLQDLRCVEGVSVTLECLLTGPEHKAKWYKNGKVILFDKEVTRANLCYHVNNTNFQAHKLIFSKITQAERGAYTLHVGKERCECFLDITERKPCLVSLRQYQEELAVIALAGQNTIICAGTNSGKTYIAFHIIEDHLINNPDGKVAFINRTNILLGQQYERACSVFSTLFYQAKIKIWKAEEDDNDYFVNTIKNSSLIFLTPQSLSNRLTEKATAKVSIADFTLIVLDECHHTFDKSNYNELMSYYRKAKYGEKISSLPQILGLTASPGTKKAKDLNSAKHHLRTVMTNLAVSKLSIVKRNEEELLQYTTIPEKVFIRSNSRQDDPLKNIVITAMDYVESMFNCRKVSSFLIDHINDCRDLYDALKNPPKQRTEIRYIQWIAETKDKVEHVLHKDPKIPRLLHACFRHLELYTACLEVNSLLEVDQVCNVITQGYADESAASQNAKTDEETEIVNKLKEVFVDIREIGRKIEKNPDVKAVIELLDREYQKCKEDSRFLIFVKTRATARALIDVLPDYLRSTYLTGSHKCIAEDGLPPNEQIAVLENFRNGDHLCVVATSVASEGLDIPLCNLMIRYRFRANEISSLQMRGRVRRSKQGKEIHVGTLGEFETEEKNIRRQYLMTKAIKEVCELDIDISNAEKDIYQMEEMDRNSKILKKKQRRQALFRVHCKYCGVFMTHGTFMRHINEKFFVVCDKGILRRVEQRELPKKKMRIIDGCQKRFKAFGLECGHDWGSIFIYQECELLVLSQEGTKVFDIENNKFTDCRRWNDLPFTIDEMSDEDIELYKS
ncbi:antiviral innate immune response receptor RIG-I-like isoform X5 [Mytilus californianus]|uniref:antiviral innate immune response receptor RIG-I-like isoform X5 n=1 Tax=Mytilus californianus TaxID=6549 RepID=UPI002245FA13|nr:antiviral innate immune response receptor RIG-I-like isoform X5 [Mytilus californianus]